LGIKATSHSLPSFVSFAKKDKMKLSDIIQSAELQAHFHTPLSEQAYEQFQEIERSLQRITGTQTVDTWNGVNERSSFSSIQVYKALKTGEEAHIIFKMALEGRQ
jgi:hypothetical protein